MRGAGPQAASAISSAGIRRSLRFSQVLYFPSALSRSGGYAGRLPVAVDGWETGAEWFAGAQKIDRQGGWAKGEGTRHSEVPLNSWSSSVVTSKSKAGQAQGGEKEVAINRRSSSDRRRGGDRRKKDVPVAVERRVEQRRKVQRRRQIDPTTCERDYTADEMEFMNALDAYKRSSGRMFPTCSEVLEVIRSLGYRKVSQTADGSACDATVADLGETSGESAN